MAILNKVISFSDHSTQWMRDEFGLEYWDNRSLSQGYAEATHELTQLIHNQLRSHPQLIQAMAGAGMGVVKLLGAIPIGLNDWALQVVSKIPEGPKETLFKLVEVPVMGFVHGAQFVFYQVGSWMRGSLNDQNSFTIANEVTSTLGTAGLLFLGGKGVVKGSHRMMQAVSDIKIVPQFSSHASTATLALDGAAVAGGAMELGLGTVLMASSENGNSQKPGFGSAIGTLLRENIPEPIRNLMTPRQALVGGAALAGYGIYETFAAECYSPGRWAIHQIKESLGHYHDILAKLESKEDCVKLRAIESLGEILNSDDIADPKERIKIIDALKPLAEQNDSEEIKLAALNALDQAAYWQQDFLKTADSEQDKIIDAVSELAAIGNEEAIHFLHRTQNIKEPVRELALNLIKHQHFPIHLRILIETGRVPQAIEDLERRIKALHKRKASSADLTNAYTNLGQLYQTAQNRTKAHESYKKAIDYDPQNYLALIGLIEIALSRKEGTHAAELIAQVKVIDDRPAGDDWKLDYNRALALHYQGNLVGSHATFTAAIKEMSDDPIQNQEWGRYYYATGKLDKALDYLKRAEAQWHEDAAIQNDLGVIYAKQGKIEESLKAYEQGFKVDKKDLFLLANFLYRLGQAKQYERAYDLTSRLLESPHAEIVSDMLRTTIFQLSKQEFHERGEGIQLVKLDKSLDELSEVLSPEDKERLKQDLEEWKAKLIDPTTTDDEKQRALVVLARGGRYFGDQEKVEQALWITEQMSQTRSSKVQQFAMIAVGDLVEGVDAPKLLELSQWLSNIPKEGDRRDRVVAQGVLERLFPHMSKDALIELADMYVHWLEVYDYGFPFLFLISIIPHLPQEKRWEYGTYVMDAFVDGRLHRDGDYSLGTISSSFEDDEKRLKYIGRVVKMLKDGSRFSEGKLSHILKNMASVFEEEEARLNFADQISEFLKSENDEARRVALDVLGEFVVSLENDENKLRYVTQVIQVFKNENRKAQQVEIEKEVQGFDEEKAKDVRKYAVDALGKMISSFKEDEKKLEYMDRLIQMSGNKDAGVRMFAIRALRDIVRGFEGSESKLDYARQIAKMKTDKDTSVRYDVVSALLGIAISFKDDRKKSECAELLFEMLSDQYEGVKNITLNALGEIASSYQDKRKQIEYAEYLTQMLAYEEESLRFVLKNLGKTAKSLKGDDRKARYADKILEVLSHEHRLVRADAVRALGDIVLSFESDAKKIAYSRSLVQVLGGSYNQATDSAVEVLGKLAASFESVDKKLELVDQVFPIVSVRNERKRNIALRVLRRIARSATQEEEKVKYADRLIKILDEELDSGEEDEWLTAVDLLIDVVSSIEDEDKKLKYTYRIVEILKEERRLLRIRLVTVLREIAPSFKNDSNKLICADQLAEMLRDEEESVRRPAARALGYVSGFFKDDQKKSEYADGLADLLTDDSESVRKQAIEALGWIVLSFESEIDKLEYARRMEVLLEDGSEKVRSTAIEDLGRVARSFVKDKPRWEVAKQLIALLTDKDLAVRKQVANVLGTIIFVSEARKLELIDLLTGMLSDQEATVRLSVAYSLGSVATTLEDDVKKFEVAVQVATVFEDEGVDGSYHIVEALIPIANSFRDENKRIALAELMVKMAQDRKTNLFFPAMKGLIHVASISHHKKTKLKYANKASDLLKRIPLETRRSLRGGLEMFSSNPYRKGNVERFRIMISSIKWE